jgi:aminoglycoside phosphotransferase (APT) family kinase protein
MGELGLPETIIHGDLNLGNILMHERGCRFIDWSEAYVGNPLVSLQHLLLLNRAEPPGPRALVERVLVERYRAVIERACDSPLVGKGLVYMPLMAAASALYGRGDRFAATASRSEPSYAYARSVARHMDRAARDPILLNTLSAKSRVGTRCALAAAEAVVRVAE